MSKAAFETVKELIDKGQYNQARAILKGIDGRQARVWEAKIDRLSPRPHTMRNISIIVLFILLTAALVVYVVLYNQSNQNASATITAVQELQSTIAATVPVEHNPPIVNNEPALTPEPPR